MRKLHELNNGKRNMAEKEIFILSDPFMEPTDEYMSQVLGNKYSWWKTICSYAYANHANVTEVWKYYNDVHQWLFRLKHSKETLFWIGVLEGTFRITFYFGSKSEPMIEASELPEEVKESWRQTKGSKFRPVSLKMIDDSEVEIACMLVDLKVKKAIKNDSI
jgi:hypothetical protein